MPFFIYLGIMFLVLNLQLFSIYIVGRDNKAPMTKTLDFVSVALFFGLFFVNFKQSHDINYYVYLAGFVSAFSIMSVAVMRRVIDRDKKGPVG